MSSLYHYAQRLSAGTKNALYIVLLSMLALQVQASELSKEDLFNQANALSQQGKDKAAYTLLASAEALYAGQLDYDWLLGTAAIESKQYTYGIFALERVLVIEPDHYESRDHQAEYLAFLKKRNDSQYDLTLGIQYNPVRYWSIKPQIALIKNDSNIEINELIVQQFLSISDASLIGDWHDAHTCLTVI